MRLALVAFAAIVMCSTPALAGPPSAVESDVDPCIITCPSGDSVFTAIIRHVDHTPTEEGRDTKVDLCGCPRVHFAPTGAGASYTLDGCIAHTLTDVQGIARFPLHAGGVCSGAVIWVSCDGVPLRNLGAVASFDQDGDLAVSAADLAIVQSKIGTADRTADFDCDGVVTSNDYTIATAHLGHHDASVTGIGEGPDPGFGARPVPNPCRGATEFVVRAPERGRAVLAVFDLGGRRLATVLDREIEPGVQRVSWTGRDDAGRPATAGLYFYRLTLGARRSQGLLVIAR